MSRRYAGRRKVAQFSLSDLIEGHYYEDYWGNPLFYKGIKRVSPYYEELDTFLEDDLYEFAEINKNGEPMCCYHVVHNGQDWEIKREISLNEALELYERNRLELEEYDRIHNANMRKKAYNYWEPMDYSGDDIVEFTDIIPINVYEGKSKYTDGGYVFNAELYIYDDVTWDEYDENESYNWAFYIIEDGSYEWGNYTGVFTGTEWEAQDWADGIIQKFIDDYEAGLITPEGMDYYFD